MQAPKEPEVTKEDINILKRMIFEMKDFTVQTDNFVRQQLLTKVELTATGVEDTNQVVKNIHSKYAGFKAVTDKLDASVREQLDIIQSLNGKINQTNDA